MVVRAVARLHFFRMAPFAEGAKPLHVILHSHGLLLRSCMCRLPESQSDHWCCQPSVQRCSLWSRIDFQHHLTVLHRQEDLAQTQHSPHHLCPSTLIDQQVCSRLHHLPLERTATLPAMPCPYTHTGKQFFLIRKDVNSHIFYFLIQWRQCHFMEWFLDSKYLYDSSYLWVQRCRCTKGKCLLSYIFQKTNNTFHLHLTPITSY